MEPRGIRDGTPETFPFGGGRLQPARMLSAPHHDAIQLWRARVRRLVRVSGVDVLAPGAEIGGAGMPARRPVGGNLRELRPDLVAINVREKRMVGVPIRRR